MGWARLYLRPRTECLSVVDTYGVDSRDTRAYQLVPRGRPPVAEPIKACDMAWNMLSGARSSLSAPGRTLAHYGCQEGASVLAGASAP